MRPLIASLFALTLTACATPREPEVRTVEIKVPVAVPCAAPLPAKPDLADTPAALQGAANLAERVRLLLIGREQRDGYIVELEASTKGCR
jgi:hypothetical protein